MTAVFIVSGWWFGKLLNNRCCSWFITVAGGDGWESCRLSRLQFYISEHRVSVISADIVGDVANYYYSQFELCTREQKMNQIILLQVQLYRVHVCCSSVEVVVTVMWHKTTLRLENFKVLNFAWCSFQLHQMKLNKSVSHVVFIQHCINMEEMLFTVMESFGNPCSVTFWLRLGIQYCTTVLYLFHNMMVTALSGNHH